MSWSILTLLSLLLIVCQMESIVGYPQIFIFYENPNFEGKNYTFTTHVPNTAVFPIENTPTVCVSGAWMIFLAENYETPWDFGLALSPNSSLTCGTDERIKDAKSFRFGGAQDTSVSAISIYPLENQLGVETLILVTDGPTSGLNGRSLWLTGKDRWTLFEQDHYQGKSNCTMEMPFIPEVPEFELGGYYDVTLQLGLSQIKSVMSGCNL